MNPTLIAKLKSINPTEGEWYPVQIAGFYNIHDSEYYEGTNLLDNDECSNADDNAVLASLAPAMREELLKMEEEVNYWKIRCKLAETCIEESPCDPDITEGQIIAHDNYHEFIKTNPTQP